ncbi:MAG: SAM-dependent chlorinase/fluorinase [Solirubrobacteraceae bacterium]|nr:SAM-dependent chlorinase/fluorinase [Solirubrobacteraceae bacterium]
MTDLRPQSLGQIRASERGLVLIAALTDYGHGPYTALLEASARYPSAPDATWLNIDHGIGLGDIRAGALTLRRTVPHLPPCVCVAVVDPGVGTDRRAIALATASGHRFVGPDNGLLEPAVRRLGGAVALVDLGASSLRSPVSTRTFDGRDLFGPVAGALAGGAALHDVGVEADPSSLVGLALPATQRSGDTFEFRVLEVDHFGTLVLVLDDQLPALGPLPPVGSSAVLWTRLGGFEELILGETFADVAPGELVIYHDSDGALSLARRGGSAATHLHTGVGDTLKVEFQDTDEPSIA